MQKIFLFFLFFKIVSAQTPFFYEPRISGTPLAPAKEYINQYFEELKRNDFASFQKISQLKKTFADIGDEQEFIVTDLTDPQKPKFPSILFVLKKTNSNINIWVEKAELNNNHVTNSVIDNIYDGLVNNTPSGSIDPNKGIYEIDIEVFGSPPDVDGNGKVDFLLTDVKDGWDGDGQYIGGFFNKNDQINILGSNKADILYIDTYPGIYQLRGGIEEYSTAGVLGTVSHELQHLLQYGNDLNEKNWVNEGLSEIASFLCGYGLRSPGHYLKNTHLALTSWDNENALPHYSRVALWTYFLYEKYGLSLISEIAKNPQVDINGVNQALTNLGINKDADDLVLDFFKTITANNPAVIPDFSFEWSALQHMVSNPTDRAINYSFQKDTTLGAYSFRAMEFTNGDSLSFSVSGVAVEKLIYTKLGFGTESYHNELFSQNSLIKDFGESHHTLVLYLLNNTSQTQNLLVKADANQKYTYKTLQYGGNSPTFTIGSSGNTNAVQFVTEKDTTLLKSVEFYNGTSIGDIKFHLYNNSLSSGANPTSRIITLNNVATPGWTRIDLENFQYFRDDGDQINVGLEYLGSGAMGYENVSGSKHTGRSYLKLSSSLSFGRLDGFSVDEGVTNLTGIWMIRLELATPYSPSQKIRNITVGPNPFRAKGPNLLKIRFDGDPTGSAIDIYNSLGQLIHSQKGDSNILTWDGKNTFGGAAGSGMYFVALRSKSKTIYKRFILLR